MSSLLFQKQEAPRFFDTNTLDNTPTKTNNWKVFMWLFLAQDAMMFFTLFAGYIGLRISDPAWPKPADILGINFTAAMTFLLICSSVTMVMSIASIQKGDQQKMRMWLWLTVLGGVLFLCGQYYEYSHLIGHQGMSFTHSNFWATFITLTSFHGCHVFCGVVYLASVAVKYKNYTKENYAHLETAGLYWHFVDLVWIILFTLVYLV